MMCGRIVTLIYLLMFVSGALTFSQVAGLSKPAASKRSSTSPSSTVRGKYLVEAAGLCQDCHTPRNARGEFIREQWLSGAPMGDFVKLRPDWAEKSANIAGLPGWTDEQAVKFLMTGLAYNDLPARLPMPAYRFNQEDAEAIVAYLRSLSASGK